MLLFDGWIDNRDEVASGLNVSPCDAAILGDARLVGAALRRWGAEAPVRLIGDFAFAWWDDSRRRLLLACDSDGGRTLYYHAGRDGFVFASRPHAVQELAGLPRAVDRRTMTYMLLALTPPADLSPLARISRLPAAGRLVWTPEGVRTDRYWHPDWSARAPYRKDEACVDAARELLDRVVRPRLRRTGPIVCQLSAGLDSPAVAATAARLAGTEIVHTVTTTPARGAPLPHEPAHLIFDEWPLAQTLAQSYPNISACRTPAGPPTPEETEPSRLFEGFGWPVRNPWNYGAFKPGFQAARELGARVLLSGLAGNATLTWQCAAYPADLLAAGRCLALFDQLVGLRRYGQDWRRIFRQTLPPLLSPSVRAWLRKKRGHSPFRRFPSAISRDFAEEKDIREICDGFWLPARAPTRDGHMREMLLEEHWSRRQMMAAHPYLSGIELRDPLGDRRMVEFCLAVPAHLWQQKGVPRAFARRVLADRVPAAILQSRRRGFQCADWHVRLTALRAGMADEIDRLERSATVREMIDLPRMRQALADWPEDATPDTARHRGLKTVLARGLHCGAFIRWVEGGN